MQRLEVSCAVRHIYVYMSLGAKGLKMLIRVTVCVVHNSGLKNLVM